MASNDQRHARRHPRHKAPCSRIYPLQQRPRRRGAANSARHRFRSAAAPPPRSRSSGKSSSHQTFLCGRNPRGILLSLSWTNLTINLLMVKKLTSCVFDGQEQHAAPLAGAACSLVCPIAPRTPSSASSCTLAARWPPSTRRTCTLSRGRRTALVARAGASAAGRRCGAAA